jgi:hypothetical protein
MISVKAVQRTVHYIEHTQRQTGFWYRKAPSIATRKLSIPVSTSDFDILIIASNTNMISDLVVQERRRPQLTIMTAPQSFDAPFDPASLQSPSASRAPGTIDPASLQSPSGPRAPGFEEDPDFDTAKPVVDYQGIWHAALMPDTAMGEVLLSIRLLFSSWAS